MCDSAANPVSSIVRSTNLATFDMNYPTLIKSDPHPTALRIGNQSSCKHLLEPGRRNVLNCAVSSPMKKAEVSVANPHVAVAISGDGRCIFAGNPGYSNKSAVFEVEHTVTGRSPKSSLVILPQ